MIVILIVEDDIHIREEIEKTVNSIDRDIRILTSKDGKEALTIIESIAIDIFIIDIGLPDWDGIALAKEIRKNYQYSPIIIESSKGNSTYQNKVLKEIKNLAFFRKPFSYSEFTAITKYAINLVKNLNVKKLLIKQNNQLRIFMLQDILYIEKIKNKKRFCIVSYDNDINDLIEEEFFGYTLDTLLELSENELIRCHKSFLVNPKMIKKINYTNDTVTLKYTETQIPLGKTFKNIIYC